MKELARRARGGAPQPVELPPSGSGGGDLAPHIELASQHASMGTDLAGGTRLLFVKKFVLRLARVFTHHQVIYNQSVLAALSEVDEQLGQAGSGVRASVASMEVTAHELTERVAASEARVGELTDRLRELGDRQSASRTELMAQRSRLELVLREARQALPGTFDETQLTALSRQLDRRYDQLYADFENTFRGSREQIRDLLSVYVDDVAHLQGEGAPVLDIGCGRGEWLELLAEHGIPGYGVDTNDSFVKDNHDRGLDVRVGDALAHLHDIDESSLGAITAFHVVEHLDLDTLVDLVDSSLRALRPGGLVIFETPNPSNLLVGASSFYMDPTHLKPLHPHFLEFLLASRGFVDVDLRFLHPADQPKLDVPALEGVDPHALARLIETINWALYGPQDYAVIGRKVSPRPA
jgi:O-antigen chain-terminating methyltransferase